MGDPSNMAEQIALLSIRNAQQGLQGSLGEGSTQLQDCPWHGPWGATCLQQAQRVALGRIHKSKEVLLLRGLHQAAHCMLRTASCTCSSNPADAVICARLCLSCAEDPAVPSQPRDRDSSEEPWRHRRNTTPSKVSAVPERQTQAAASGQTAAGLQAVHDAIKGASAACGAEASDWWSGLLPWADPQCTCCVGMLRLQVV